MDGPILSRAAARALDRRTIEEHGLPGLVLMENAGRAAADEAQHLLARSPGPVLVLCGPGNNGGDGLVIARTLQNRGLEVDAVFVGPAERLAGGGADFQTNLRLWRGLGRALPACSELSELRARWAESALVVDALFGTGLTRPLDEPWRAAIGALNAARRRVLAVDLPSGLDADTGAELGAAVRADVTVTFVAQKSGLLRGRGPELAGRVVVAEIGIPRPWIEAAARA
ncbi:MAG TPA: NAD(P)H-hydrate epimerase [Planctomycetota bacterium]